MRKLTLLVALVASFAMASAQDLKFGIKAGVNAASVVGSHIHNADAKAGFVIGSFVEKKMTDRFGLSAELLYSNQGYKKDIIEGKSVVEATATYHYLNFPLLANVYLTRGLSIKAGLQPGFNLSSSVKTGSVRVDSDNTNVFDLSVPVGLAYQFDMGLLFDIRYNIGLTHAVEHAKIRNSVFQFTAGWRF
ncbi:MAG: porin family protein [Phocaeicola sp.]